MHLPPQRPNEPEWLKVKRANKAADHQFARAFVPMQVAMAVTWAPLLLFDPSASSTFINLVVVAAYGVAIVIFGVKIARPKTKPSTINRCVVNYISIFWAIILFICIIGVILTF